MILTQNQRELAEILVRDLADPFSHVLVKPEAVLADFRQRARMILSLSTDEISS